MPERKTVERAAQDKREGKSASTQAGEFVKEEMEHIREGKHGARSTKQAIAIGLSKARRAGVDLAPPKKGTTSKQTRESAERAYDAGHSPKKSVSRTRSRASSAALKREPHAAASKKALAAHARAASSKRSAADRSTAARKAAKTRSAASSTSTRKGARGRTP